MPRKFKRVCNHPACNDLTEVGYCPQHKAEKWKASDAARGTAGERGYDGRWQRYRRQFLRAHPFCERCEEGGHWRVAKIVHHVRPVNGKHDPLFFEPTNHQALCRDCHEEIHRRKRQ